MAGANRKKMKSFRVPVSAPRADSNGSPKQFDLWPEGLGQPPWDQGAMGGGTGGSACTAFAVGAAVYWHELKRNGGREPGTPDFQFIYNNESFLTKSMVQYFEAVERGEKDPQPPLGFHIMAAARVAAVFGVPFLPGEHPAPEFNFTEAPPHNVFVAAREHLYAFHHPFRVARVDPNHPEARDPPDRAPRHRKLRRALLAGSPVVMGINSSAEHFLPGARRKPADLSPLGGKELGKVESAHAVLVVGFDDTKKRFRFRNSWGPEWGTNGYATIPYDWIDSPMATFGITTFSQPDGTLRPFIMLDRIRVENLSPVEVTMYVSAHDARCNYLGTWKCFTPAGKCAEFNPVRWLDAYRLDVVVRPTKKGGDARRLRMWVDDEDGSVASSAEIVVQRDGALSGKLLGVRGAKFGTVSRAIDPSERLVPISPARGA